MSYEHETLTCSIGSCSCSDSQEAVAGTSVEVRWQGAQRDVLGGDIRGKVDLQPLAQLPDLFGLVEWT